MAYNIILKNGRLKFDKAMIDCLTKPHKGMVYGLVDRKDPKLIEIPVDKLSDINTTIKIEDYYIKNIENITYTSISKSGFAEAYIMFSRRKGKTCNYTCIKGKLTDVTKISFLNYYQILSYGVVDVIDGSATFANKSFKFCYYTDDEPDEIIGHFIKMQAGQSGDERKLYNYFDLHKGKFIFPDRFVYSIKYDNGKFVVHTSKDAFPDYYDLDGNRLKLDDVAKKDKIIIEASNRYRRVNVGKTNPIDCFVVKHRFYNGIYDLFKDYDYDEDEFVGHICQFTDAIHVIDLDGPSKNGKSFKINQYEDGSIPHTSDLRDSDVFSSRIVDKIIKNNDGDILLYTTPGKEIRYIDLNEGLEEHTMYKAGDYEKISIKSYSIYDYKRHNILLQIGYNLYGYSTKYVDFNGNIKGEFSSNTSSICYEDKLKDNGFFQGEVHVNGKDEKKFFVFNENNGNIEEVDMNGVSIGDTNVHDGVLYVEDDNTKYVHKYDMDLNCIDDENITMQEFKNPNNNSDYGYVVYHKDTKTYDIMPSEYNKQSQNGLYGSSDKPWDFFSLELNDEPYRPYNITIVGSMDNREIDSKSMIAFIAERYVDGKLKKTLFMNDGKFAKDDKDIKKGRKLFAAGEYDDITVTDLRGNEGCFRMSDSKKDMEANRIYITDGDKTTIYGIAYTPDGHIRLSKKKKKED